MATLNLLSTPATRSPAGLPILLTLASEEVGDAEYASAFFSLDNYVAGDTITFNGVTFTAVVGPELGYCEFVEAFSAVLDISDTTLAEDYTVTENGITAKRPGPAWNLQIATSATPPADYPATPNLRNQQDPRVSWGAYVELYAYPLPTDRDYPVDPADEVRAELLARLELPYGESNAYTFDLAAWVNAVVESPGRCVAWFCRYGEKYATPSNVYRRRYEVGRWPVTGMAWAFAAALPIAPYTDPREPVWLTSYAGPRPLYIPEAGSTYVALSTVRDAGTTQVSRIAHLADGTNQTFANLDYTLPVGRVFDVSGQLLFTAGVTGGVPAFRGLRLAVVDVMSGESGPSLLFEVCETPLPYWLQFRNRLGGLETWGFASAEPTQKRTLATYQPADGTIQTRRVDLTQSTRLTSGLLTRDAFDFLCAELATSPDVLAITAPDTDGPAVNITDFDPKTDVLNEEYSIALTIEPRTSFTPLTR